MLVNHRTPAPISFRSWLVALAASAVLVGCGSQPPAPIATPMVVAPSGGPVWTPPEPAMESAPAAEPATAPAAASAAAPTSSAPGDKK